MGAFLKNCNVFISHKRDNGQARVESTLIYNVLKSRGKYSVRMDVRENTLSKFPETIPRMIDKSDVFVLIIPKDNNVEFLQDTTSWVYQEVQYALSLLAQGKNLQILPICFNKNFKWPEWIKKSKISAIGEYDVRYYDTNDKYCDNKLCDAICFPSARRINYKSILLSLIALSVIGYLVFNFVRPSRDDLSYERFVSDIEMVYQSNRIVDIPDSISDNQDVRNIVEFKNKSNEYYTLIMGMRDIFDDNVVAASTTKGRFAGDLVVYLISIMGTFPEINDAAILLYTDFMNNSSELSGTTTLQNDAIQILTLVNKNKEDFYKELSVVSNKLDGNMKDNDKMKMVLALRNNETFWQLSKNEIEFISITNKIVNEYLGKIYGIK